MTTYACIQADPPWAETGGGGRGAQDQYDVVADRGEIAHVLRSSPSWRPAKDCHLWCWTTMSSLADGLWLVDALGFRYVTHFAWVNLNAQVGLLQGQMAPALGIGQYLRGAHELCLLGVRGDGFAVRTEARDIPSVLLAPVPREQGRRVHSRKPPEAYDLIERRSHGPRLECFARIARPGWDRMGNQAPADEVIGGAA